MITRPRIGFFGIGDIEALDAAAIRKPSYRCDNLARRIKASSGDVTP